MNIHQNMLSSREIEEKIEREFEKKYIRVEN
jgi:hypothetical protein